MTDMAVMTQTLLAQMMPNTQGLQGLPGLLPGEQSGSGGDAFMQLILQLLSNSNSNASAETDVAAMLEQVVKMRQDEEAEEEGVKTAVEMMAEMLFAALPAPPQLAQPVSVQDAPDRTVFPKELAAQDINPQIEIPKPEAPVINQEKPTTDNVISFRQILTKQSDGAEPKLPPMEALRFQSTVQEVRETLRTQPQPRVQDPAEEVDIEALQANVDMKRFLPQTAAVSAPAQSQPVPAQEVVEQLRTGILENLEADKSEFVVKLKPEGLGEITVKLVETEGKILLNIVTSSPQVAKALNQEVAALQNSLRPLQAQVQEITVAQEILASTQYGTSDHRFENRQQFAGQQNRSRSQRSFSPDGGIDLVSASAAAPRTYDTGLDAYI